MEGNQPNPTPEEANIENNQDSGRTDINSELETLRNENSQLQAINSQLSNEINQLKSFLLALTEKPNIPKLVNYQDYERVATIGEGASATVDEVQKTTKEKFAMKELKLFDHTSLRRFLQESEFLCELRHPCIVRIYGYHFGDTQIPPSLYLSLEPSTLERSIQMHSLTHEEKNRITVEIVLGMRYLHSNNVMHRNLKPSNILLSRNNHARIGDFALAKEIDDDLTLSQTMGVGTLRFMAPELIEEAEDGIEPSRYDCKIDVYSFGVILFYIVNDIYPPLTLRNRMANIPPPMPPTVIPWVADLIRRCLQTSPFNRPSFNDILQTLKAHNFDLFNNTNPLQPTPQQQPFIKAIQRRILKIEAFEYQHLLYSKQSK